MRRTNRIHPEDLMKTEALSEALRVIGVAMILALLFTLLRTLS